MSAWRNSVEDLTLAERNHNGKFLARNYTLNGEVEISYFKSNYMDQLDEIYIRFGVFNGVIYCEKALSLRTFLRLTIMIENEYLKNKGVPSKEFILKITKKYCIQHLEDWIETPQIFRYFEYVNYI